MLSAVADLAASPLEKRPAPQVSPRLGRAAGFPIFPSSLNRVTLLFSFGPEVLFGGDVLGGLQCKINDPDPGQDMNPESKLGRTDLLGAVFAFGKVHR